MGLPPRWTVCGHSVPYIASRKFRERSRGGSLLFGDPRCARKRTFNGPVHGYGAGGWNRRCHRSTRKKKSARDQDFESTERATPIGRHSLHGVSQWVSFEQFWETYLAVMPACVTPTSISSSIPASPRFVIRIFCSTRSRRPLWMSENSGPQVEKLLSIRCLAVEGETRPSLQKSRGARAQTFCVPQVCIWRNTTLQDIGANDWPRKNSQRSFSKRSSTGSTERT